MPWDATKLWVGKLNFNSAGSPSIENIESIAGGENISVFQPEFSPDGKYLAYTADESGWWQLYAYDIKQKVHKQLTKTPAEHGKPAWVQGMRTYGFSPDSRSIFFIRNQAGKDSLWMFNLEDESEE